MGKLRLALFIAAGIASLTVSAVVAMPSWLSPVVIVFGVGVVLYAIVVDGLERVAAARQRAEQQRKTDERQRQVTAAKAAIGRGLLGLTDAATAGARKAGALLTGGLVRTAAQMVSASGSPKSAPGRPAGQETTPRPGDPQRRARRRRRS